MLRVIAGKYKGLSLKSFELENIRPTIDRVKEAIFSKIQFLIKDDVVLDLFAGTGNYGIECLSRGAKEVIFVDVNKNSVKLINQNLKKCGENREVLNLDFKNALLKFKKENKKFDIIFLDPPFKKGFGEEALQIIAEFNLLSDDGIVVYEHACEEHKDIIIENLNEFDLKKYGTINVSFFERIN